MRFLEKIMTFLRYSPRVDKLMYAVASPILCTFQGICFLSDLINVNF